MADRPKVCRYCGIPWPGDEAITLTDLLKRVKWDMPICLKGPPPDRWFKDSGINGHMFDVTFEEFERMYPGNVQKIRTSTRS